MLVLKAKQPTLGRGGERGERRPNPHNPREQAVNQQPEHAPVVAAPRIRPRPTVKGG